MRKPLHSARTISWMCLAVLSLFCSHSLTAQEQIGRPMINNYNYQDYQGAPINWWALEDDQGNMYFANQFQLLQYDGVNWKGIETESGCRSLAKGEDGTIYVGGTGSLGYISATENGTYEYVSMVKQLPEEHQAFEDVWFVDSFKGRIYFWTEYKVFIWDGTRMKVLVSEHRLHVSAIVDDTYYIRIWDVGLSVLNDQDEFELLPNGEKFAGERIYSILKYDDERILLGTRTQGFFLYDGKDFTPFKTEIDDIMDGEIYLPGLALDDGRFVINSNNVGAYLLSHEGELLQKYTSETGLQEGSVLNLYLDSRGVLWLPLFNGISNVNLNSSFTTLDSNMGINTTVFEVVRHQGVLYMSSNGGILYLDESDMTVRPIEGTYGQGGNFLTFRDRLYVATNGMGLIEIIGTKFRDVRRDQNYDFRAQYLWQSTFDPNRIFVTYNTGLKTFFYNETTRQLEEESTTTKFIAGTGNIIEEPDGSLWLDTTSDGEVLKVIPDISNGAMNLDNSELIYYGPEQGLPDSGLGLYEIFDEKVIFSGEVEATFGYNASTDRFEEKEFFFEEYIDWDRPGSQGFTSEDGKHWFNSGAGIMIAEKKADGKISVNTDTFRELKNNRIFTIYPEEPDAEGNWVVWFSGPGGVIRYQGQLDKPSIPEFQVNVRSITMSGDSLLYAGNIAYPGDLEIDYENNSMTFGYAAPLFIGQKDMKYSTWLTGLDDDWSDWTAQTSREYINLPPGSYTFKVRAQNVYGDISEEASVPFSIDYPWYRSWWAYALYLIGFLAIIWMAVKARTGILLNQQKVLEDRVEERTREVQQRLNELATVNSVSQALNDKLELNALIQLVGKKMKDVFNSDITYLAILDEETNVINFVYQDGDEMPPMQLGEGLTSRIIQSGEPLLINRDTDIMAEYNKHGIKQTGKQAISYLGVPIPVEDKIIGVLSVQSTKQASRFTQEDKKLLTTIAINVGVALHNADLYEQAREAKARAEDANEAKSAFLSTVSHELRTPLTSVLGFAKIIRKRLTEKIFPAVTVDDQKIKRTMKQVSENLDVVVSEGERLTTLINDVLDLAKIESGRMDWNMKPIFLQDVIGRAVSATSSLFEEKKLQLKKNVPDDLPLINGDEDKLIQVVINLLSNAVKFTKKGSVTIDAYREENQLIVEVQDTGIGIAEEDKHKIFERFRQAGDTLTDKPQGTGLGLPICREIIEHHGGIIWMKSEPGVGSTFFFSIPMMGEGSDQPIQLERILKSLKKQIKHSSQVKSQESATILVVDDDTPIRSLLRQELSDAGYQVKEAANGKAALDMVRISKPDLIILDVMMPEINGFDVAAVLKNDPATMDIPIIILSIVQDKERGLRIGVDRYLTKPIDTEKLFHEVDELLEQGVSHKRVLVVDEDTSTVKSLSDMLSARGYKVMEANPDSLMDMAFEVKPDIIMLKSIRNGDEKSLKELKLKAGMENVMFFVYQ
ncbi:MULTISPECIES: ATP-binding protein [Robiginitalea]|uniref:histidine kinase n=1 Tax=Robiginitalea biformata (strain ATCC BAA-864 / DSM 15991 / KCTC 12146 / HTCC2501) TaxID=313596 RepID=A4CGH4_ROBBH|nr:MULTISPECIES: ATP-binding protein [Robiginitalea]EAR16032.1 PAS/PAC Sensor Hybrid Histidine Kinase [Robiginitalea biformata HTCC2501]MDC6354360.1 ATP-binding protein [Robiginitalea sp. PM2]MDC6374958.1 ATP-binding protein [Robiginitalea sp. SP8]